MGLLTGQRFLAGYTDDETQYRALMDAGITLAKAWHLRPGVALSAAQVAQLTSDILWLESRTVTLPDGSTREVLVPQLYARPRAGDLDGSGTLLAGSSVAVAATGDFTNSGTVAGRRVVDLAAANIQNLGGRIAGTAVSARAENDLLNLGGRIEAVDSLTVKAGRDIRIETTTASGGGQVGGGSFSRTQLDRVAGLYVTGAKSVLTAAAGRDLTLVGADISNAGDSTLLRSGRNLTLSTVTTSDRADVTYSARNTGRTARSTEIGTTIRTGGDLALIAGQDIAIRAGTLDAKGDVALAAARDVTLTAGRSEQSVELASYASGKSGGGLFGGKSRTWSKEDQVSDESAVATRISGRDVTITGGRDVSLVGSEAQASGDLALAAGRDLNILADFTGHTERQAAEESKKSLLSSRASASRDSFEGTTAIGSVLSGQTVTLSAGQDINIVGSQARAVDDLAASAGRDLNVLAAQTTSSEDHFASEKRSGFSASFQTGVSVGKSSLEQGGDGRGVGVVGSSLTGRNVDLDAGRNATLQAATVIADQDVILTAGKDIAITTAIQGNDSSNWMRSSSSSFGTGLIPTGPRSTIYSKTTASSDGTDKGTTEITSLISANTGSIAIVSGQGNFTARGADLIAAEKITLSGKAIDLQAASERSESAFQSQMKSVTVGAQLSGIVGSKITAIADAAQTAQHTDNDRLAAAATLKAGYDTYKFLSGGAADGLANQGKTPGGDPSGSAFGISFSVGTSKSQTKSQSSQETQRGTNLQAKDIVLVAREGDITATGAKIQGENIALDAAGNIALTAARNSQQQTSSQSGSSSMVGVTFGFGQQNGISFQVGASSFKGKSNGSETTWDNTLVTATNTLTVRSGGDTTLSGAQLGGRTVKANVGGNLLIETRQDQSDFNLSQSSGGFGLSLCIPPLCFGTMATGSINMAKTKVDHNYLSAVGQSGIAAGAGGFDITVGGTTDLRGGAITSTAGAGENRLSTGRLTFTDLTNRQHTASSSSSAGFGYGGGSALSTLVSNAVSNGLANLAGPGGLPKDGDESSRTLAVISPANITITGGDDASRQAVSTLTGRDPGTANQSLKNTLTLRDAAKLQADMKKAQENAQAAQMVGSVMTNAIGDFAQNRWPEGSPQKIALHGLAGLIEASIAGGKLGVGVAAGALNEALLPQMAAYLSSHGIEPFIKDQQGNWVRNGEFDTLMKAGSSLVGAAVGALAGGNGQNAQTGARIATTATENNYLSHMENEARLKAARACAAGDQNSCKTRDDWDAIDRNRDNKLREACYGNGASAECSARYADMLIAQDSYRGVTDDQAQTNRDIGSGLDRYTADREKDGFKTLVNVPHKDPEAIAKATAVFKLIGNLAVDMTPLIGDGKAFAEAETKFDYALAIVGTLGPPGDTAKALIKEAKLLYEAGNATKAAEKLSEAEKAIAVTAGKSGNWDRAINGQLKPSSLYEFPSGHIYATDAAGRVKSVEGQLSLNKMDRNTYQQCAAGKCGEVGDDGGHLIASSLGGAGDKINIVPQASTLNRGDWRAMENELRKELKDGKEVSVRINVGYPASRGARPSEFQVIANIGGQIKEFKFRQ